MQGVKLLWICLFFTTSALAASFVDLLEPPTHLHKLSKRECKVDLSCAHQDQCDQQCLNLGLGFMLGVCHGGKCYCGWMPE